MNEALPSALPPEAREDARQFAFLAVLEGELQPREIAPRALKSYARAARGMSPDRYRFISLSAPLADGRTFGELLEG